MRRSLVEKCCWVTSVRTHWQSKIVLLSNFFLSISRFFANVVVNRPKIGSFPAHVLGEGTSKFWTFLVKYDSLSSTRQRLAEFRSVPSKTAFEKRKDTQQNILTFHATLNSNNTCGSKFASESIRSRHYAVSAVLRRPLQYIDH